MGGGAGGRGAVLKNALFMVEVHLAITLVYRHTTVNNVKVTRIFKLNRNIIMNPNWQEAASWLFTKGGRVESRTTGNKSKPEVRTGFEPVAATCKPNALTTEPCCSHVLKSMGFKPHKNSKNLLVQFVSSFKSLLFLPFHHNSQCLPCLKYEK